MKVNLSIGNPNCRIGYLNLDPLVTEPGSQKVKSDVSNIDEYVDNGECDELIASDILSYFDSNKVDDMLTNWLRKIRKNGIIEINDIDINSAFKSYQRGEIDITKMNSLIFGEQIRGWDLRKCGLTLDCVSEILRNKGFEIIKTSYHNYNFIVRAKRIN